jgi:hypothetical protein
MTVGVIYLCGFREEQTGAFYSGSDKRRSRRQHAPVVTSGISRSADAQSFGGVPRGRVCVREFIGVSVRAL